MDVADSSSLFGLGPLTTDGHSLPEATGQVAGGTASSLNSLAIMLAGQSSGAV